MEDRQVDIPDLIHGEPDGPASIRGQPLFPEPPCSPIPHSSPQVAGGSSPGVPLMQPTPSPGCKRFVGISSNARNDIYMQTLMNSPYHKSYTPLSATPGYSPMYKTPVRNNNNNNTSPMKGVFPSPRGFGSAPLSARKFVTPKGAVNPFDTDIDDLGKPVTISPGLFTISSTPASEKCFRWSIEHIAELHPADIDEMPVQQNSTRPDRETEERAQKAIEQFFANNLIVPSPWSDPKQSKRKNVLPSTPAPQGPGEDVIEMMTELQGSIQKALPPKQGMEDASCQTVLSLPVNFDLQKVLGAYMMQDDCGIEGNQQEMLSTSSLRRKLFFHGDTSSLAPSPVKPVSGDDLAAHSPIFSKDRDLNLADTTPLKNTPAFSSSPIKSFGTPLHRRCSSDPEFLASPELSPIVHGNIPNSGIRKARSSGMFSVNGSDIDISPVTDDDRHHAGHGSRFPFAGNHPNTDGDEFRPKFVDSPGFSPIRPPKTPIRKILRRSQEESYIQDEGCTSEEEADSITPVSSNPKIQTSVLTPVDTLSPIQKVNPCKHSLSKSYSGPNLMQTMMDFELVPTALENRFTDNILTSSLCETRDFSLELDYQDETHLRTNSSNQDTGYQTASLQSTNQESVSLHTNLTNQFGSLPFNLTNQDIGLQNISQVSTNKDKATVLNLAKHFTNPGESEGEEEDYRAPDVRRSFDKHSLPKQNLFAQNMFTSDESDTEATPKTMNLKSYSNDSAFGELPQNNPSFITEPGSMEIDGKKGDNEEFYPDEKAVFSRARQALAMANSLYPRGKGLGSDPQSDDSPMVVDPTAKSKLSASEFAFTILQKAGEDLAKYEKMFSSN